MGKSSFMSQCREIAVDAGFATTWVDETVATHDLVHLMDTMASDLGSPSQFSAFQTALETYRENRHRLEAHSEAPEELARVIAAGAGRIGTKLARSIPEVGDVFDLIDEDIAGDQLGEVASFVLQQARNQDDAFLLLEPVETLTPLFLEGVEVVATDRPVGLFFDTFEDTSPTLEPWLLQLLRGEFGSAPLKLLISIAGQRSLDLNAWGAIEPLIHRVILEPLSEKESQEYLTQKGVQDPRLMQEMVRLTKGIPIQLVSIAIDDTGALRPSETLVDRVLSSITEELRSLAVLAAIPRTLNKDVAAVLFGDNAPPDTFDQLRSLAFVQSSATGWKYHSVIRAELLQYGLKETPDSWTRSHGALAEYFKKLRDRFTEGGDYERAYQADAEHLYHGMCARNSGAIKDGLRRCIRAFGVDPGLARRWATAMRDAERDLEGDWESGWGALWLDAIDEYVRDHEAPVSALLTRIFHGAGLPAGGKAELLEVRSDVYRTQSRLDAALSDIESALALRPEHHELIYKRALIYLDQREFAKALEGCAEAVRNTSPDNPKYLNYRVMQVRMSLHAHEPATSLELVNELLKEAPHPWAFLTRGQILRRLDRPKSAVSDFEKVLEVAPGHAHEAWKEIALCQAEAGNREKAEGALEKALEEQPKCTHCWEALAALYVQCEDLDGGVAKLASTCRNIGDPGVSAYRARGFMELQRPDLAAKELQTALEDDPSSPDYRLWLARALAAEHQFDKALKEVEEALRLRPEWPDAIAVRGNLFYAQGDHGLAEQDWIAAEGIDPRCGDWVRPEDRGLTLSVLGEYAKAVQIFDQLIEEEASAVVVYNRAIALARLRGIEDLKEEMDEAEKVLVGATPQVVSSYGLAGLKAVRGEEESALAGLEEALSADGPNALHWAKSDPAWNDLRDSPRFQRLIAGQS
jgi:tetratricopeptide (TPR) repeat protein